MILTKKDLKDYLLADYRVNSIKPNSFSLFNYKKKFYYHLRNLEYAINKKKKFKKLYHSFFWRYYEMKTGWFITPNTCEKGLAITHLGPVRLNNKVKIGEYCRIDLFVNIGIKEGEAPEIGNHVYIGPGAKIFGGIKIADGIAIGANAVVNKSFLEPYISIAGVPAKKVSDKGNR